ncbi:MAG TPA: hypothetical protein VMC43_02510 [Candidatus Paceibacterota bacterium]|nr:hypothetical protein [Candidatus Paceibacterota bacterium]
MDKDRKDIKLTPEQYRALLKSYLIGNLVQEDILGAKNKEVGRLHVLESYLLSFAGDFKAEDLVELKKDELLPSQEFENDCSAALDDYDEHQFWYRLAQDLAERDFRESATISEWRATEASGLMPDRVKTLHDKYHEEFDKRGLEKLRLSDSEKTVAE